ncbi:4-hydroxy-3-methylbut-2-enyl diphosphatereductase [Striga asiatica]|uniref:4-hydroxy-3-methylbut-2-enyl diphosphatereductase n=1 Tax=Striga asiatica TaxID=4170 RepID=A0A5A7QPL8_STRAF|nr:4-hydroxy-3-methylbut-2-enyl diphosphatereductase [Striga asiatica]
MHSSNVTTQTPPPLTVLSICLTILPGKRAQSRLVRSIIIDLYLEKDIGDLKEASERILRLPGIVGPILGYLDCRGVEIVSRTGPKSMKSEVGVEWRLSFGEWFVLMGFRVARQRVIGRGGKIGGKRWDFGEARD